jgi:hypothetical protein
MESYFLYFIGVLAYSVSVSLVSFGIAFFVRRKQYTITWLRSGVVLIVGWLLGSVILFLVQEAAKLSGIVVENTPLEIVIVWIVFLPVMFRLLDASKPKPSRLQHSTRE